MKAKDIFTIVVIAIISAVISIILSNSFISSDSNRSEKVEVIGPIVSDFERPPEEYFNNDAVNPTQTIQIGSESSNQPFGSQ